MNIDESVIQLSERLKELSVYFSDIDNYYSRQFKQYSLELVDPEIYKEKVDYFYQYATHYKGLIDLPPDVPYEQWNNIVMELRRLASEAHNNLL